ncbi:helix-turn-helix transcriptional regulator [Streptomyces sp. SBT349]|uniref:helix-turn-helix transcriptional regulator n=1 Tax=Streptomyces sp. SBT349 TaxID=1580539 RepID=UPI00066E73CD|nr:helix-turn-helix transcriptional regulator [Streptomyces sp. SBT349]
MYRERPSRLGGGAVVWSVRSAAGTGRVLPDGCMDLMWMDGGLVVAGPDTRAHVFRGRPATGIVGLRFAPGAGPCVLGVPADELTDLRVPLADLWPASARVRELTERVAAAGDRGAALEALAAARRAGAGGGEPDGWRQGAVAAMARGLGVGETARRLGLSERQLRRRSMAAFGYGPKTLARVLRMQRALALARGGTPLAEVAAVAGYADQAHLSREVRELAGVPITVLRG